MSEKLVEVWSASNSGTIRQRRKVRRLMARQKVPVLLDLTGGEFLELQDHARRDGQTTEDWLHGFLKTSWRTIFDRRLGSSYEVRDDTIEGPAPPPLGKTLKKTLGLTKGST